MKRVKTIFSMRFVSKEILLWPVAILILVKLEKQTAKVGINNKVLMILIFPILWSNLVLNIVNRIMNTNKDICTTICKVITNQDKSSLLMIKPKGKHDRAR